MKQSKVVSAAALAKSIWAFMAWEWKQFVASMVALAAIAAPARAADIAVLSNGFSIRHERREVVGTTTRLYLTSGSTGYVEVPSSQIDHFEKDSTPATAPISGATAVPIPAAASRSSIPGQKINAGGPNLGDVVSEASTRHQLDPDLVTSVIRAESNFNFRAVSPKGAQGLMQLMPKTASQLGVANAFDPKANVEGGTQYLRTLLEQYNFDLVKALAAYNAGPQRVTRYGGVPPYYETQEYVARIVRDFNRKKLAEKRASLAAARTKSSITPLQTRAANSANLPQRAAR